MLLAKNPQTAIYQLYENKLLKIPKDAKPFGKKIGAN
jgi:hypothetical protein